jgi:hypothetical protein
MLLPSALPCDTTHRTAPVQSALFASPPTSPVLNAQSTLFATCRALQSMLSSPNQLPSPPVAHAPPPSNASKLRLRARNPATAFAEGGSNDFDGVVLGSRGGIVRRKITKRSSAPRGLNKRRRAVEDESGRDDDEAGVRDEDQSQENAVAGAAPNTPKRRRLAPAVLPMGLARSDFRMLQADEEKDTTQPALAPETADDGESAAWTSEEDRILVELVLEKLKLTKSDWQDCARSLGKDRGSVGRRWKTLMGGGEVGLKRSAARRAKIHGTWR